MDLFKFGWLLFLVMRGKIKIDKNYEEALHLLLSSINVVLVHLPATHRKISVRDLFSTVFYFFSVYLHFEVANIKLNHKASQKIEAISPQNGKIL